MIIKNFIGIVISMIIVLNSCDPADNRFKVINRSNDNIHAYYSCDSTMSDLFLFRNGYYKDKTGDSTYMTASNIILKDSSRNFPKKIGNSAWIDYLETCNNKTLYVFFLTDSILDNFTDEQIKADRIYKTRYKYTLDEMMDLNWTIEFPAKTD